ncbi:MAG: serine/threonine protein kinase, partial [Gemmataceae bacterium]|nr:serine/threonine protein kinase [Gemmataceae bacterium]
GRTFVVAVGPRYELLALNDLGVRGMYNASLAVANGRLFLRSERTLYCLGKQ